MKEKGNEARGLFSFLIQVRLQRLKTELSSATTGAHVDVRRLRSICISQLNLPSSLRGSLYQVCPPCYTHESSTCCRGCCCERIMAARLMIGHSINMLPSIFLESSGKALKHLKAGMASWTCPYKLSFTTLVFLKELNCRSLKVWCFPSVRLS